MDEREELYVLELLKITTANGKVRYQAVDGKTADNIINTSSAYTHLNNPEIQFDVQFLGDVEIYPPDWMKRAIVKAPGT